MNIQTEAVVNEDIRAKTLRVIGVDGNQLGIMTKYDALNEAKKLDLDLVVVAPEADPPVCKIIDYGKFKYQQQKHEKEIRHKQTIIETKELRLTATIDSHDLETKLKQARKFLEKNQKVRFVLKMRGREITHTNIGFGILDKCIASLADISDVEKAPSLAGNTMFAVVQSK